MFLKRKLTEQNNFVNIYMNMKLSKEESNKTKAEF